ncbi:MAG: hypothetical protein R3284_04460, partial [Rubricoccaceae bacterium]|nr:hypothetical protein [Rubricoccaceae bacterium]
MDISSPSSTHRKLARPPVYLWLLSMVGFYLRFGYLYGSGDQDEILPAVFALLDPSLFQQDWITQEVLSGINVRTAFIGLLASGGVLIPVWLWTAILYVMVWGMITWGVYALAMELLNDRIAASLGVLVTLVITCKFTLGLNSVVYNSFLPGSVAWPLALLSLTLFLQRRFLSAGILLGIATWFQLLVGGLTAGVLVLTTTWNNMRSEEDITLQSVLVFAESYLVTSLPITIPVAISQFVGEVSPGEPSSFFIYSVFRIPWHQLFFSFGVGAQVRFWTLLLLALASV